MHEVNCRCDRCAGLRRYPQPSLCHWCNTVHAGDAFNCPSEREKEQERESLGFRDDPVCDQVLQYIKQLTNQIKENVEMIRAPQSTGGGDGQSRTNGGGSGRGRQRTNTGFPFIKVDDLSYDKVEVKIVDIRENTQQSGEGSNRFSDYILKVNMKGQTRRLGLKITNPVFKTLYDNLGPDENNWPGRKFFLFLEEDDFSGQNWMRAEIPTDQDPSRTGATKSGRK